MRVDPGLGTDRHQRGPPPLSPKFRRALWPQTENGCSTALAPSLDCQDRSLGRVGWHCGR